MSHIHFVGGEKGGVGKSVMARLLAQWFIDRSQSLAAIDADQSHAALLRFYADYTQPVDLTRPDSADQIMDRALGAERQVLVDLPGQSTRALNAWMAQADVLGFAREMGIGISFWHVTDGSFASVSTVGQLLDALGQQVQHIVVKNFGRSQDFSQFDASETRRRLDELSGKLVELPALEAAAMYRVDALGASFWAAANASAGPLALKPLERQRVRLWLQRAYAPLDALAEPMAQSSRRLAEPESPTDSANVS